MTNFEKYKDDIVKAVLSDGIHEFVRNKAKDRLEIDKDELYVFADWLTNEAEIGTISEDDWSNVEQDTLVYVKAYEEDDWRPRYFSKYENGYVYVYLNGATSKTSEGADSPWKYARIEEEKVDWSKIPIDTMIYVKEDRYLPWLKRRFAGEADGIVYTWGFGTSSKVPFAAKQGWDFAKIIK